MLRRNFAIIVSVLVFVSTLGAAIAAYDMIRPFPTIAEHQQVAGRSCENQLNWLSSERRAIERDLGQAGRENNTDLIRVLQQQLRANAEQIDRTKKQCGFS